MGHPKCHQEGKSGAEDVDLGKCMEGLDVPAVDSRDKEGKNRFFPFNPDDQMFSSKPDWYYRYQFYEEEEGPGCCSDQAISFHYVSGKQMYLLDYLIYHLQPHKFGEDFIQVQDVAPVYP